MKVVSLEPGARRDAWLARLCAAVHGTEAGLAPLVAFSGTRHLLFPDEAARLWALVDEQDRPRALALLVMDESGEGMALTLAASLEESREPLRRLIRDLALNAPLRVTPGEALDEVFLRACGISRWVADDQGRRVGLTLAHPALLSGQLSPPLAFDDRAVLRRFKQERAFFETEKRAFVAGLDGDA
ncbi:hypothetical protein [Halomonas sp. BM-2019]|uniref:hypothetical protein n=1 Tax=Halomonas sp. BM-2019 TaxID=2811227 RepID=UPI001B3C3B0C|nr:MAG: hypothetical protein J5F18_09030 [Halomonas sp. BM-2019]